MRAVGVVPSGPVRTCIGCRRRSSALELLRVVVAPGAAGISSARRSTTPDSVGEPVHVVPDPRRRMPGRGAWLHPDPDCVALAARRRAFGRALRVPVPVDVAAVGTWIDAQIAARISAGYPSDPSDENALTGRPGRATAPELAEWVQQVGNTTSTPPADRPAGDDEQ